jgi:hypothetical protein
MWAAAARAAHSFSFQLHWSFSRFLVLAFNYTGVLEKNSAAAVPATEKMLKLWCN